MFEVDEDMTPEGDVAEQTDDALYCAKCGHLVARTRWAYAPEGDHERVFFNPAGRVFRLRCFIDAPGAADRGPPTGEFTWFKGYDWNFALCRGCGEHLGWRYTGQVDPPLFWGLIKERLTSQPK